MDWDTVKGWGALAIASVSAFIGYGRWQDRRATAKQDALDKIATAAEKRWLEALDTLHARVTRHDEANRENSSKLYAAVLDLYKKDERTQQLLLAAEQRAADRFEKLLMAVKNGNGHG